MDSKKQLSNEEKITLLDVVTRKSIPALILFCFLLNNFSLVAQKAPVFLPDNIEYEPEEEGCVCSPGVINKSPGKGLLIEYKLTTGGSFTPDEVAVGINPSKVNNLERLRLRLKIPVIIKPKVKVLIGLDHFRENYLSLIHI